MGRNKTITSFFEDKILVHFNHLPLVISFIGTDKLNVGEILSFADEIKKALDPIKASIKDSDKDIWCYVNKPIIEQFLGICTLIRGITILQSINFTAITLEIKN